jgi:6-pyruvoyltetrahydropterin/6-carboxytetrahydropterin synthase
MFEITVTHTFSAAHAIYLPDGSLEPMHGHNWQVQVTVGCQKLGSIETVMDFHELERLVSEIVSPWHNQNLNEQPPFADCQGGIAINPSAERVAQVIGEGVAEPLPEHVQLQAVTVSEAPGCLATYRP